MDSASDVFHDMDSRGARIFRRTVYTSGAFHPPRSLHTFGTDGRCLLYGARAARVLDNSEQRRTGRGLLLRIPLSDSGRRRLVEPGPFALASRMTSLEPLE